MSHRSPTLLPWQPMGPHFYYIDDDTVFVQTRGDATLESTILYTDLCRQLIAHNGYVLSIVDLTISGSAPPEARRYQAKAIKEFPQGSNEIALYGMNRVAGAFVQLTARAVSMLTGREPSLSLVSDAAAALLWRDERRPVLKTRFGRK